MKKNFTEQLMNKLTGLVLLAIGSLFILWGYNESESMGAHLVRLYSDKPIQNVWFYYLGGGFCVLLGVINLLRRVD